MTLLCLVLVASSVVGTQGAPAQNSPPESEWIHIDGSKSPELIPEYMVWQQTLSGFALIKTKGIPLPPVLRNLPPAERDQIFEAALWEQQQAKDCMERQERKTEKLRKDEKPNWKAIDAIQKEIILECRQEVLDRVAGLLPKLSDQSRTSLLAWAEESKTGMWARVHKTELEFFRKPR